jgi:hypothetical protein
VSPRFADNDALTPANAPLAASRGDHDLVELPHVASWLPLL